MTPNDYQNAAHKTAVYPHKVAREYLIVGLAGEVGELSSLVAKYVRKDHGSDPEKHIEYRKNIKSELGDILWFVAEIASLYGFALENIMDENIAKLADRQARGVLKGSGDER